MDPALYPCAACSRHIRNIEVVCPFCSAGASDGAPEGRPAHAWLTPAVGRAAIFAGAMLLGPAIGACGVDSSDGVTPPSPPPAATMAPIYGGPPPPPEPPEPPPVDPAGGAAAMDEGESAGEDPGDLE